MQLPGMIFPVSRPSIYFLLRHGFPYAKNATLSDAQAGQAGIVSTSKFSSRMESLVVNCWGESLMDEKSFRSIALKRDKGSAISQNIYFLAEPRMVLLTKTGAPAIGASVNSSKWRPVA